ncbi:MAG: DUF4097 family beta strand repeat-containing protein [Acholeplasmataceae bacterium]|nr:DUF4097 family beta strand repeat-containing protein [Acholeplasmataceae bacterium]
MMKYLEDLKNELIKQNVNQHDIDDIIRDHDEMISEALREGLSEEEISQRLGDPRTLAKELSSDETVDETEDSDDDYKLWDSFTPISGSNKVTISMVFQDIEVRPSKDSEYHVYHEGPGDIKDYHLSYEKGELKLESPKLKGLLWNRNKKDDISFIIEIPKNIEISEFKERTVSGDIRLRGINAHLFSINTTSGDLDIKNGELNKFILNTVSGDARVSKVNMVNAETSQVSGDITMEDVNITELIHVGSVSGDISLVNTKVEHAEFSMVNGDVDGKEFYPNMITFKSVSGDLNIKNQDRSDIKLQKTSTISGKINIT